MEMGMGRRSGGWRTIVIQQPLLRESQRHRPQNRQRHSLTDPIKAYGGDLLTVGGLGRSELRVRLAARSVRRLVEQLKVGSGCPPLLASVLARLRRDQISVS